MRGWASFVLPRVLCAAVMAWSVTAAAAAGLSVAAGEPDIRVLLDRGRALRVSVEGPHQLYSAGVPLVAQPRQATWEIHAADGAARLFRNGRYFGPARFPLVFQPASAGLIRVGDGRYRGTLEVVAESSDLLAINVLSLEEYLYGVVGCEMPVSWPLEALKAQAVACRTYAVSHRAQARRAGFPYDLGATAAWQVYRGVERESARVRAAVDGTRGQILTYAGSPIRAVYHSSSGGHTASSQEVWGVDYPYLQAVPDHDQDSPYAFWSEAVPMEVIQEVVAAVAGDDVMVTAVEPVGPRSVSGRWPKIRIRWETGELVMSAGDFRLRVGLPSTVWEEVTVVLSEDEVDAVARLDFVDPVSILDARGRTVRKVVGGNTAVAAGGRTKLLIRPYVLVRRTVAAHVLFRGRGWGHGVGMSQWGAKALAERGWTYRRILQYYYPGTRLDTARWSWGEP